MAERVTRSDLTYRAATLTDEDFLAALYLQAREELTRVLMPIELLTQLIDLQRRAQRAEYLARYPDSVDELIMVAGHPVGHCWTGRSDGELRLLDLTVAADWQCRGIATAVLDELLARATREGRDVTLSVWSDNRRARALYEGAGFVVTADEPAGYLAMRRATRHGFGTGYRGADG